MGRQTEHPRGAEGRACAFCGEGGFLNDHHVERVVALEYEIKAGVCKGCELVGNAYAPTAGAVRAARGLRCPRECAGGVGAQQQEGVFALFDGQVFRIWRKHHHTLGCGGGVHGGIGQQEEQLRRGGRVGREGLRGFFLRGHGCHCKLVGRQRCRRCFYCRSFVGYLCEGHRGEQASEAQREANAHGSGLHAGAQQGCPLRRGSVRQPSS